MARRLPRIADQTDMVDYAVSEMLRRFEADLDDGTPMEQAQLIRSPIIDKILAALKYFIDDNPPLLRKIEDLAKEGYSATAEMKRQDAQLLALIKEVRGASSAKLLERLKSLLVGTFDSIELAAMGVDELDGSDSGDLELKMLDLGIQQCDTCGVWAEIHEFEVGGDEGLTCENCLNA